VSLNSALPYLMRGVRRAGTNARARQLRGAGIQPTGGPARAGAGRPDPGHPSQRPRAGRLAGPNSQPVSAGAYGIPPGTNLNAAFAGSMPGAGGPSIDDIMGMLGGGGGGSAGNIGAGYDAEINALRRGGSRMAGLTNQLIGNINASAGAANQQIGGFFNYAKGQAESGRPVIGASYDTARGSVDQTYDQFASQIAGLPQATADAARAAGGAAAGSSVADRVAVAAAPFAAAGESSRAASQANLQTHSTAGQDYLTQLASAAPAEGAQHQAAVTGRANMAVTNAQMQLAAQQAEIEARAASIEGAKQRALLEASADTAGSTAGRMMDALKIESMMMGNEQMRRELAGEGMSEQRPGISADEKRLFDVQRASDPDFHYSQALAGTDPRNAEFADRIRGIGEQHPGMNIGAFIGGLTNKPPSDVRKSKVYRGEGYVKNLDEYIQAILAGDTPSLYSRHVDPQAQRRIARTWAG
jgi:hypothetical protein